MNFGTEGTTAFKQIAAHKECGPLLATFMMHFANDTNARIAASLTSPPADRVADTSKAAGVFEVLQSMIAMAEGIKPNQVRMKVVSPGKE